MLHEGMSRRYIQVGLRFLELQNLSDLPSMGRLRATRTLAVGGKNSRQQQLRCTSYQVNINNWLKSPLYRFWPPRSSSVLRKPAIVIKCTKSPRNIKGD